MNRFWTKKPTEDRFYTSVDYYSPTNLQSGQPGTSEAKTSKSRAVMRNCLKPLSKNKASAAPIENDASKKMWFSEMVSPRATHAVECLSQKTKPSDIPASRWLARDGLKCVPNAGGTEAVSFAISMIQHATGYYGPTSEAAHSMRPELVGKINDLINNLSGQINSGAMRSNATILAEINKTFPNARLSATVLDGNTNDFAGQHRVVEDRNSGSGRSLNNVLLLWEDNQFKAVVADHIMFGIQRDGMYGGLWQPLYGENCLRASLAADKLQEILTTKDAKARSDQGLPASDTNPALADPILINRALMPLNIERVPNDATADVSLIAGLLQHATGVYERHDLPVAGQLLVTEDEPLHALEARVILDKVNAHSADEYLDVPIGWMPHDKRIQMVIEHIVQHHGVELNLMLVEARSNGLHQTGLFSARPDDNGAQLDNPSATSTTYALLHNGDSFEPLRESIIKLNPELHSMKRMERKTLYGKSMAMIENAYSPFRRAAHRMSDDELIAHTTVFASTHGKFRSKAYQKELNKRQNVDRFDHGTQTLAERFKSGFRNLSHADNPYAKKTPVELLKILKDEDERPFLVPKEKRLIQAAAAQNAIENTIPSKLPTPPPAPRPLAKETDVVKINADFKRLMRTIDMKALKEDWTEAQFDSNDAAPEPWKNSFLLQELESATLQAWHCAQKGFINGATVHLDNAITHLEKAHKNFQTAKAEFFGATPGKGTEQFMTADGNISRLLQSLKDIRTKPEPDTREKGSLAFQEREQLFNGLTVAEVETLADIRNHKLDLVSQKRQLQNDLHELVEPLNFRLNKIDAKTNEIHRIAHTSTASEVMGVVTRITSITSKRLINLRVRATKAEEEKQALKSVIDALEFCRDSGTNENIFDAKRFADVNRTVSVLIEDSANHDLKISLATSRDKTIDIKLLTAEQRTILIGEVDTLYKANENEPVRLKEDANRVQTNLTELEQLIAPLKNQQTWIDQLTSRITALEELDRFASAESQRKIDSEREAAVATTRIQVLRDEANSLVATARTV